MRGICLFFSLCGIAPGQIDPEAARLFHNAAQHALQNLPKFDLEVDSEVGTAMVRGMSVIKKHESLSVRQPGKERLSIVEKNGTDTYIVADDVVTNYSEYLHSYGSRPAFLNTNTILNPPYGRELAPVDHAITAAELLRHELLKVDGMEFRCTVISVTSGETGNLSERVDTIWIDESTGVALRQETHNPRGMFKAEATHFVTGDGVRTVSFDRPRPEGWKEDNDIFETTMLAFPTDGVNYSFSAGGTPFTPQSLQGKPTILTFVAAGCGPCDSNRPEFDAAAKALRDGWGDAMRVIVVDPSQPGSAPASAPPDGTIYATTDQVAAMGIQLLPAFMITTPQRRIFRIAQGSLTQEQLLKLAEAAKSAPVPTATSLADAAMVMAGAIGVVSPVPTFKVPVAMTSEAKALHIAGRVRLTVVVQRDGTVRRATVSKSLHPVLDQLAVDAVQKWLFKPGTRNGELANVIIGVEIEFKKQ